MTAPPGAGPRHGRIRGVSLQAWCVYLMAAHAILVHCYAELIRALIITASVVSADETPSGSGRGRRPRKKYLLVACTNLFTY